MGVSLLMYLPQRYGASLRKSVKKVHSHHYYAQDSCLTFLPDGNHPTRSLHLHFLRKGTTTLTSPPASCIPMSSADLFDAFVGRCEAYQCRYLEVSCMQKGHRWRGMDRIHHRCCHCQKVRLPDVVFTIHVSIYVCYSTMRRLREITEA